MYAPGSDPSPLRRLRVRVSPAALDVLEGGRCELTVVVQCLICSVASVAQSVRAYLSYG